MNKRLAISLAAFVGWLLITVVGGQMHTGEAPLLSAVTRGLGWPFLLAALFLLALVVWQQCRDVLVLPNALYGLWLMRNISKTHTLADL